MRWNLGRAVVGALLLLGVHGVASAGEYAHYLIGNPSLQAPGKPAPGLLLMGGGDAKPEALRWFLDKAGNGHVVVLRATRAGEFGELFHDKIGGVASVETFVLSSRAQSTDPKLLASLRRADGIFIAGGHQSRYVRFWKATPVAEALDAHVKAGKPLAGTSAGLAILGEFVYGAMDGGSQTSARALADPLGPANTIETGFLHIDALAGIITDTHFRERDRLGRLIAYIAKAETLSGGRAVLGLGVDEEAVVAVEADGSARVYANAPGAGAIVVRGGFAQKQVDRKPMNLTRVETIGIGVDSVLHLPSGRVERPMFERSYAVRDGALVVLPTPLPVVSRQ